MYSSLCINGDRHYLRNSSLCINGDRHYLQNSSLCINGDRHYLRNSSLCINGDIHYLRNSSLCINGDRHYLLNPYVSALPLSGVNSRFLAPPPFPAFHSDCPVFLAYLYFEEKKRSVRSDRRQVELRRLGNQLSVLGKANSLCKIVKCCVCCLFVKLRLSPGCVRPGDKR